MIKALKRFFELEATTGILLVLTTIIALFISNSQYHQAYNDLLLFNFLTLSIKDWINDALMAIFFLLMGLELKKEVLIGELSSKNKINLPLIAAFGGVFVPAIIFCYFNFHESKNLKGFAIPTATDIAFAYGMISLFGKKISRSLKIFLISLAVIDDLVAIIIIAIFYSQKISIFYLFFASLILFGLFLLNSKKHSNVFTYIIFGILLWFIVLKSGVHPTLAGILLALFIPLKLNLSSKIAPLVNFFILPIFAFANAGVKIDNFSLEIFSTPLVLGIMLGLFIGKQMGIMLFSFVAVKLNIASLPRGSNWLEFYVAAIFAGIGFTMSLFIGFLAFSENDLMLNEIKIAILSGSLLSIIYGFFIAFFATKINQQKYEKK